MPQLIRCLVTAGDYYVVYETIAKFSQLDRPVFECQAFVVARTFLILTNLKISRLKNSLDIMKYAKVHSNSNLLNREIILLRKQQVSRMLPLKIEHICCQKKITYDD